MQNKNHPVMTPRRGVRPPESCPPVSANPVVSTTLALVDGDAAGYDPYNKPPPVPTEIQLDAKLARPQAARRQR